MRLRIVYALSFAALLAGCGGGGGGNQAVAPALPTTNSTPGATVAVGPTATPAPGVVPTAAATQAPVVSIPPPAILNQSTTYSVFTGNAGPQYVAAIAPYGAGAPSYLANAVSAPGAVIYYPDSSIQIADTLGNFDASQADWTQANLSALLTNPALQPTVTVTVPNSATPVDPIDATVLAYVAAGTQVVSGDTRRTEGATGTSELAAIHVLPRGAVLFNNENRTFSAAGADTNGTQISLKSSAVTWKLAVPAGCTNAPAGKLRVLPNDAAKVTYVPPTTGSFPANCQDLVSASIVSSGSTFSASGNAFYFDLASAVQLSGTVTDPAGKPVAAGIVSFYGDGLQFAGGNLYATIKNGAFSRLLPSNRTISPTAANVVFGTGKPSIKYYTLSPATLAIGAPGTKQTQAFTETAVGLPPPPKVLPPVTGLIRDSWFVKEIAEARPPFGVPDATGKFTTGSVEAIVSSPAPNAAGTVKAGANSGWLYKWDSSGKIVLFAQPANEGGGRRIMQVTVGAATFKGAPCPAGNACFAYTAWYNPAGFNYTATTIASPVGTLPAGTFLDTDGGFAQPATAAPGQPYTIGWVSNQYSPGRQVAGSPLSSYQLTYAATLGSQSATIAGTWLNADGKPSGTLNVNRTAGTQPGTLFTYTGTSSRLFYKEAGSTGTSTQITYGFTGTTLSTIAGTLAVTLTASPVASDIGSVVNWTFNDDAQIRASGLRATGNVQNPNVKGLASPPTLATFKVTPDYLVTVVVDPALGSNPAAFHL